MAARGLDLVLVARRGDRLASLAEELRHAHGVQVQTITADLSDPAAPAQIEQTLAGTAASAAPLHWLINNAGSGGADLLRHRNWVDHRDFLQLMMLSVAELCHRLLPGMAERGYGRVINVASVAGRIALPSGANYGPSKAYLIALSEELAQSFGGTDVNVTALCPGFVHTEFHETPELAAAKAGTPRWIWYRAERVVRDGLRGCERGAPIVVSGPLYRWLDLLLLHGWTRPLVRRLTRSDGLNWRAGDGER